MPSAGWSRPRIRMWFRVRGCTGKNTGKPRHVASGRCRVLEAIAIIDVLGSVERGENEGIRLPARDRSTDSPAARARASGATRRRRRYCRSGRFVRPGIRSARKFFTAWSVGARHRSARWSVTTRLCSSGMPRSKLRKPASTWTSGISRALAASAPANAVLVSPCTTTAAGRAGQIPLRDAAPGHRSAAPDSVRRPPAYTPATATGDLRRPCGTSTRRNAAPRRSFARSIAQQIDDAGQLDDLGPGAEHDGH